MALRSGLAAQIGYAAETTVGTIATPNKFLPLISETLTADRQRLEAAGIIPGRQVLRSPQWNGGPIVVGGGVQHEMTQAGMGLLLKHALGTAGTITGTDPYTHPYTLGDLFGLGLTVQVGRPGMDGTVHPYTYAGCKIAQMQIAFATDAIVTCGIDLVGMSEGTATALASASYTDDKVRPYKFNHLAFEVDGDALPVKSATLTITNPHKTDRRFAGSQTASEAVLNDLRTITLEMVLEHTSDDLYNDLVVAGAEEPFEASMTSGTNSLTFAGNARYDGTPATMAGKDVLEQTITAKVVANDTDAAAFVATMINAESAL